MFNINIFNEEVDFSLNQKSNVLSWIVDVVKQEGCSIKELNYIFCSDDYLININQQFLNHDTFTDIITFDNSNEKHLIESDIYISVERVAENAQLYNVNFEDELHRVMVHGVLHLMGWSDKTDEDKQAMRQKEDACLSLLSI